MLLALSCVVSSAALAPLSLVGSLDFESSVNSLHTAFDWGGSQTCKSCAYATISTNEGANPQLISLDLVNFKVISQVSLATSECPNFKSVGVARLTLETDVEDTIYVAQANTTEASTPACTGRVLLVSSKNARVTGTLNSKFPGRFDGTNFRDIAFNEDEVQIVGDRYLYGWCPLCVPSYFSVADFGCGPLRWGAPDQFVADNGEPNGGVLAFKTGLVSEVFAGMADIPDAPSWGRPNSSVAVGDCCYFATAVAVITYREITPPWPPIFEYYSEFFLARSRDGFKTESIFLGRNTSVPPFDKYMFGPNSRGVLDTYEDNGAAYWVAYKTKGTKGEGPPVLLRVDFTFPTYQFGSVLEFDSNVVSINSIASQVNDPLHIYLAVTLADGKGQILKILTGTKSPRQTLRAPRKTRPSPNTTHA